MVAKWLGCPKPQRRPTSRTGSAVRSSRSRALDAQADQEAVRRLACRGAEGVREPRRAEPAHGRELGEGQVLGQVGVHVLDHPAQPPLRHGAIAGHAGQVGGERGVAAQQVHCDRAGQHVGDQAPARDAGLGQQQPAEPVKALVRHGQALDQADVRWIEAIGLRRNLVYQRRGDMDQQGVRLALDRPGCRHARRGEHGMSAAGPPPLAAATLLLDQRRPAEMQHQPYDQAPQGSR